MMQEQSLPDLLNLKSYEANHGNIDIRTDFFGYLYLSDSEDEDSSVVIRGFVLGSNMFSNVRDVMRFEIYEDEVGETEEDSDYAWLRAQAEANQYVGVKLVFDSEGPMPFVRRIITVFPDNPNNQPEVVEFW